MRKGVSILKVITNPKGCFIIATVNTSHTTCNSMWSVFASCKSFKTPCSHTSTPPLFPYKPSTNPSCPFFFLSILPLYPSQVLLSTCVHSQHFLIQSLMLFPWPEPFTQQILHISPGRTPSLPPNMLKISSNCLLSWRIIGLQNCP